MTKIDDLLRTLDALSNANKSGYHCNSEMDTVISALLDELKAPAGEMEALSDLRGVKLADALYERVEGDVNGMLALRGRLNYALGGDGE